LSKDEIDSGITSMKAHGFTNTAGLAKLEAFLSNDTGRQFLMVNNIDKNEHPPRDAGKTRLQTGSHGQNPGLSR